MDYLSDEAFRLYFRMNRDSFRDLLILLGSNSRFDSPGRKQQSPLGLQTMVFLYYVGTSGNASNPSKIGNFFGISKGSVINYTNRVTAALCDMKDDVVFWPDADERSQIGACMRDKYQFPFCVGIADGSLLPLQWRPPLHGDDYFTRKSNYAVNVLVVCDDTAAIRAFTIGWPGSVHDNCVWKNSPQFLRPADFFSIMEYLLGDSAFAASGFMVPNYKKASGVARMNRTHEFYNTKAAKGRIKSEHCLGLLKNRFPILRCHSAVINGKKAMRRLVDEFTACAVLHNMLIEEPDIPDSWYEEQKDNDEDDTNSLEVDAAEPGDARRDRLLHHILDHFGWA